MRVACSPAFFRRHYVVMLLPALSLSTVGFAQAKPEEVIKIVAPEVDKTAHRVTLPAAFWNEHLADWVEVAVCGRPSDFLHETIVSITTTRTLLEQALRDAGFHDADAWADSVKDFPRVRGDRMLILLEFTRDGKKETFSIDELLEFQGWGIAAGPYGFMFKGDPKRPASGQALQATAPASQPVSEMAPIQSIPPEDRDAVTILRDDPQIALSFKGLQNVSQSFADYTPAYDDWVYPMMNFSRNTNVLPSKVYDSNGDIPVTLTFQKVTEEEFLTQSAKVWHDDAFRHYMLQQLPIAQQVDKDKAALWAIRPNLIQLHAGKSPPPANQRGEMQSSLEANASALMASIEKNYATLDAAWATWAADHAAFESRDDKVLATLKAEAAHWKEHKQLIQTRAEQLALAEAVLSEQMALSNAPAGDQTDLKRMQLNGREIRARSAAQLADNKQSRDYWLDQQKNLDPANDPRVEWVKDVALRVALAAARESAAKTGIAYGDALAAVSSKTLTPAAATLQTHYAAALLAVSVAETQLALANIDFEISKREGFENDPDLPGLQQQRDRLRGKLRDLQLPAP